MSKKYKKPPIIEALCEFQFVPSQKWDSTIPGLFYKEIEGKFPDKQERVGVGIQFKPSERGGESKVESAPPMMQFYRKDKTALVQVRPNVLAINHLKPYPSWPNFKPVILDNLNEYKEITNPKGFKRIGFRYINRIDFKDKKIELTEYFNFYPQIPKELPQNQARIISRVELIYEKDRDRLLMTIGTVQPESPDTVSIMLDLDYVMLKSEGIDLEGIDKWIEQAHSSIEDAFENCITDKCRALFGEIK